MVSGPRLLSALHGQVEIWTQVPQVLAQHTNHYTTCIDWQWLSCAPSGRGPFQDAFYLEMPGVEPFAYIYICCAFLLLSCAFLKGERVLILEIQKYWVDLSGWGNSLVMVRSCPGPLDGEATAPHLMGQSCASASPTHPQHVPPSWHTNMTSQYMWVELELGCHGVASTLNGCCPAFLIGGIPSECGGWRLDQSFTMLFSPYHRFWNAHTVSMTLLTWGV